VSLETVEQMKQLLTGIYEETEKLEDKARKNGAVSEDFCNFCDSRIWDIIPFRPSEEKTIDNLIEWVKKYQIISIKSDTYNYQIEIKSKKPIYKGSRINTDAESYIYFYGGYNDTNSKIAKEIVKVRARAR